MIRILLFSFLLFFISHQAKSQISPKERKSLHYRIIGFSFPKIKDVSKYTIELADGDYEGEREFKINIIKTFSRDSNRIIGEVPFFARSYTWRIVYYKNSSIIGKSDLFHFNTLASDAVDQCANRLQIIKTASKYKNAYVFLDSHNALYDMDGHPVWFLPNMGNRNTMVRDLKPTPFGTITYMIDKNIFEINYEGDVIWKGPSDSALADKDLLYHHEFSRLSNGNYMALRNEIMWAKKSAPDEKITLIPANEIKPDTSDRSYRKVLFGTIVEYDKNGNEVWSWKSSNFLSSADIVYHGAQPDIMNTHLNAFFFDEKNKNIYLSFKRISTILKIKYPEGIVLNAYGGLNKTGMAENHRTFFCEQHSCMISQKGYLYLYNNNVCNEGQLSRIIMLKEPASARDTLKPVWEYECTVERTPENMNSNYKFTSGGNVIELPDQSIFAYMGQPYSKVFIVGLDKNIIWSALPEKWNKNENKWRVIPNYRASILTDKRALEDLIWSAQK